jgi:hypothetical protein
MATAGKVSEKYETTRDDVRAGSTQLSASAHKRSRWPIVALWTAFIAAALAAVAFGREAAFFIAGMVVGSTLLILYFKEIRA